MTHIPTSTNEKSATPKHRKQPPHTPSRHSREGGNPSPVTPGDARDPHSHQHERKERRLTPPPVIPAKAGTHPQSPPETPVTGDSHQHERKERRLTFPPARASFPRRRTHPPHARDPHQPKRVPRKSLPPHSRHSREGGNPSPVTPGDARDPHSPSTSERAPPHTPNRLRHERPNRHSTASRFRPPRP